ncbi:MAG: ferritin family protein [Dehalococcoidales bacterium]|jgi:rubrerythrin
MTTSFSPGELIKIAIGIERSGITFFDIMARTTDAEMAREIFEQFVQMEREHLILFQDMQTEIEDNEPPAALTPEDSSYLQALIDDAVFTNDAVMNEAVSQADSDIKALEVGISAEKDSILFYQALKDLMPRRTIPAIAGIISEEKSHLQQLTAIKKKLATGE